MKTIVMGLVIAFWCLSPVYSGPSFPANSEGWIVIQEKVDFPLFPGGLLTERKNQLAVILFELRIKEMEAQGLIRFGPEITPVPSNPFFEQLMIQPKLFNANKFILEHGPNTPKEE